MYCGIHKDRTSLYHGSASSCGTVFNHVTEDEAYGDLIRHRYIAERGKLISHQRGDCKHRASSRTDQRSLFGIMCEKMFESLVNRRSPGHIQFVREWTRGGERSNRMALNFMSNTRVDSEQLPGSPFMAWAKMNKLQNQSKLWLRQPCHISYTFQCATCSPQSRGECHLRARRGVLEKALYSL